MSSSPVRMDSSLRSLSKPEATRSFLGEELADVMLLLLGDSETVSNLEIQLKYELGSRLKTDFSVIAEFLSREDSDTMELSTTVALSITKSKSK